MDRGIYDPDALERDIRQFCRRNPNWRSEIIGYSRLGRAIRAVRCGRGGALIHAAHHANEWMTSAVLMRWLRIRAPNLDLTLVPMVNPDGVALFSECLDPCATATARAMAGDTPFPDGWKANMAGVDLNLNYPAGWHLAVEIKAKLGVTQPSARDWPGPAPLSEPETQAMVALTAEGFDRSLSLHSQGGEIYWDYDGCAPCGALALAQRMAAVSGYTVTTPPETASHAGYKDWFLLTYHRPSFTVEIGHGENPLPLSDFPQLCREVFPLLDVFCGISA